MPKVSIILPVYNGAKTLRGTILSLLDQTFNDFELCICNDGSEDESDQIIGSFSDPRIRLFRNEKNMGLGRTLNKLVANTQKDTRYIAMAEQDDYYYPERLKIQFAFLELHPEVGMVSGIAEHFDGEKVTFRFPGLLIAGNNYPDDPVENFLLHYCYQVKVVNSCMMFRKDIHLANGLYFSTHYPSISVDWSYVLRFSLVSKIKGITVPMVRLDRRADRKSLTSKKNVQFSVAREVIRNFYFEKRSIITLKNYRTAWTTEYLLELGYMHFFKRLFYFPFYFLKNPIDPRWLGFFKKSILKLR